MNRWSLACSLALKVQIGGSWNRRVVARRSAGRKVTGDLFQLKRLAVKERANKPRAGYHAVLHVERGLSRIRKGEPY